jgi:hypothetical protein
MDHFSPHYNQIILTCVSPDPRASASTHACTSLAREPKLPPSPLLSHHRFDMAEVILGGCSTTLLSFPSIRQALGETFVRTPYMRCACQGVHRSSSCDIEIRFFNRNVACRARTQTTPFVGVYAYLVWTQSTSENSIQWSLKLSMLVRTVFCVRISDSIRLKARRAATRRTMTPTLPRRTILSTATSDLMLSIVFSSRKWL